MIERERRRLQRAFRAALLAASGPAVMMACGGGDDASDAPRDAGTDATLVTLDAGKDTGAAKLDAARSAVDAADAAKPKVVPDATPPLDAFAASGCYLGAIELDSGPEAAAAGLDTCLLSYGCGLPQGLGAAGCIVQEVEEDGGLLPTSGYEIWLVEEAGCTDDVFTPTEAGACTLAVFPCPAGGGRRTAGLRRAGCSARRAPSRAGAYLAAMAFEEEASVAAFARMRSELLGMRAPQFLVRGAARAERDETRHARIMASLARSDGAEPAKARVRRVGKRSALAVALENATEGCVRETYGALALAWQAARAGRGDLRQAFTRIARDEVRHAALSWALAHWLDTKLDAKGRARVQNAKARAVARLVRELRDPPPTLARDAGLPTAAESRALLASLTRALGIPPVASTTRASRRRSPRS